MAFHLAEYLIDDLTNDNPKLNRGSCNVVSGFKYGLITSCSYQLSQADRQCISQRSLLTIFLSVGTSTDYCLKKKYS